MIFGELFTTGVAGFHVGSFSTLFFKDLSKSRNIEEKLRK